MAVCSDGASRGVSQSPPREGGLRHQEDFGEAHLSVADGVVDHTPYFGVASAKPIVAAISHEIFRFICYVPFHTD
jgi:hypothetical protein